MVQQRRDDTYLRHVKACSLRDQWSPADLDRITNTDDISATTVIAAIRARLEAENTGLDRAVADHQRAAHRRLGTPRW